jgi:hypothetical protein
MNAALAATPTAGRGGIADVRAILILAGISGERKDDETALGQQLGLPFQEGWPAPPATGHRQDTPPPIRSMTANSSPGSRRSWHGFDGCRPRETCSVSSISSLARLAKGAKLAAMTDDNRVPEIGPSRRRRRANIHQSPFQQSATL